MKQVFEFVTQTAWALEPRTYGSLVQIATRHFQGEKLSKEDVESIVAAGKRGSQAGSERTKPRGVAVIPVKGVIARFSNQVNGTSTPPGTSVTAMRKQLSNALADESVHSIMLDIDSPGGSVHGVAELAREIRAARGTKPIVAAVDGMMASAAYWLGSQADRVVATETSMAGSIGVLAQVVDDHRLYESAGVDVDVVRAGKHKAAGAPGVKMTPEDRATLQATVDDYYDMFIQAVADGRQIESEQAKALGDGRMHVAERAVDLGLIDAVGSWEDAAEAAREIGTPIELAALAVSLETEQGGELLDAAPGHVSQPTRQTMETEPVLESVEALAAKYDFLEPAIAGATEDATQAERARCAKILGRANASQLQLAATLVEGGADYATALETLMDDPRRDAAQTASARDAASPPAVEPIGGPVEDPNEDPFGNPEAIWQSRADVREAFGENEGYFKAAMRNADRIKVGNRTLTELVRG